MSRTLTFSPCLLRKKGLTLVELLLVIGIIALLIGITWAVFAYAQEKARRTTCMSNLRQIWLALQAYRDDYDGVDPDGTPYEYWELGLPPCIGRLYYSGYIKNWQVFRCPNEWRDVKISYLQGWWEDKETWAIQRKIRFSDWIAKIRLNLDTILDYNHDQNYKLQILPLNDHYFAICITLDGTIKVGWRDVPGDPP